MLKRLFAEAKLDVDSPWAEQWASARIHRVASPRMAELGASSKLNAEWAFLSMLREDGRERADEFLARQRGDLGVRSTYDIDALLDTILEQA